MKQLFLIAGILSALMIAACTQAPKEITATAYVEPAEMQACTDSVEAFAAAMGPNATFEGYQAIYEHFLQSNPTSTVLHRDYQSLFDGYDKSDLKVAYYKQLAEKNPQSATYAYLYGRCLNGDETEKWFRKAVELDPKYYWGNFGLASRLASKAAPDTTAAIDYLNKAIAIDNSNPLAFQLLATIYLQRDDYTNALKFADMFATALPNETQPLKLKTDISIAKGDYPGAIASQRKLIGLAKGNSGSGWFDLAKLFLNSGQNDSALSAISSAADAGFADYRRLERAPIFAPVRSLPNYAEVSKKVEAAATQERNLRLAVLKDSTDVFKSRALAQKLDVPAPAFSFTNLEGKTVSLAGLKGKVVVIDFWATWCGPCRMTMPLLQEFVDRKPAGVEYLAMDVWERDTSLVRPFIADQGYNFNVLYGDQNIATQYGVQGIPTMFVIDKNGVIRYQHVGYEPLTDQTLAWETESLL